MELTLRKVQTFLSPSELVPRHLDGWFEKYEYGAPTDLQKSLVATCEARDVAFLLHRERPDKLPVDDYLRFTGAAKKGASFWLTTVPSEPAFEMSNGDFRYAIRHRLGLPEGCLGR